MLSRSNPELLERTKIEIEDFLRSCERPMLLEGGAEIMDFTSSQWRLRFEFGKLLLETWDGGRSIIRRIEDVAYRDEGKLGLFVRNPAGRGTRVLEFRGRAASAAASRADARRRLRLDLTAYLGKYFPEWRIERIANRSDRERSFSAWYARGLMRRGQLAWAFAGLDASESTAAADSCLAYGINWLDWLREAAGNCVVAGLKLFLPAGAIPLTAQRVAHLNPDAARIELIPWPNSGPPQPVSSGEFANLETHLSPRRDVGQWVDGHGDLLSSWFGKSLGRLDIVPDSAGNALSFRVFGLEVARMEGQIAPKLFWGVEGQRRVYREGERLAFQEFIEDVTARRAADGGTQHELYRAQPERWLESLLLRDLTRLDPELSASRAYPQVPAFSGRDRGIVDILGISKAGRLAVIELKVHEEIALPLQGLDYWMRVKWLNDRQQFHAAGYFPGMAISPAPPVLYLVSPAFRFHPANERIIAYFHPSIEVIEVGLNQQWREGVKVLFRKSARRA